MNMQLYLILTSISLMTYEIDPLFLHFTSHLFSFVYEIFFFTIFCFLVTFLPFHHFLIDSNYIFWMLFNPVLVLCVVVILPVCGLCFHSLLVSFNDTKIVNFNVAKFISLCLYDLYLFYLI